jgi:hypothetical protein
MLLHGRPIAVWAIFGYSVIAIAAAGFATVSVWMAEPGTPTYTVRDKYGTLGLILSIVPASILFLSGLSLFLLKRWAIWLWALTALIMISGIDVGRNVSLINLFWLAAVLAVTAYVIWLRRIGVLR